jgi:hypothetical protein
LDWDNNMTNGRQQLNNFMEGTGVDLMPPMGWFEPSLFTQPLCKSVRRLANQIGYPLLRHHDVTTQQSHIRRNTMKLKTTLAIAVAAASSVLAAQTLAQDIDAQDELMSGSSTLTIDQLGNDNTVGTADRSFDQIGSNIATILQEGNNLSLVGGQFGLNSMDIGMAGENMAVEAIQINEAADGAENVMMFSGDGADQGAPFGADARVEMLGDRLASEADAKADAVADVEATDEGHADEELVADAVAVAELLAEAGDAGFLYQEGQGNFLSLDSDGSNNGFSVIQLGDRNTFEGEVADDGNVLVVTQTTDDNFAIVESAGGNNVMDIEQNGLMQTVELFVDGMGNTALIQQGNGEASTDNVALAEIIGDDNQVAIVQAGAGQTAEVLIDFGMRNQVTIDQGSRPDASRDNVIEVNILDRSSDQEIVITQRGIANTALIDVDDRSRFNRIDLVQGGRNNLFDMSDDSDGVDDKSNRNEVSARQGGKNNIATVELRDESRANLVTISQLSSDSELVVRVDEGRRNTIDVIQAKGQVNNYAAVELFGSVLNEVSITQNGSDNVADLSIEEGSRGIFGDRNKVTITQELDGNDVGLLIEGNRNQFTAIQSNADSVDAILKGDLNQVSVTQELGGNIVTLTIEGSDNWFSATQGEASTIIAAQYGDANVMTLAQVGMNNAIYATQR